MKAGDITPTKFKSRRYPVESITDADDLALSADTVLKVKLFHSLETAGKEISLYMNAEKNRKLITNRAPSTYCLEII